MSKITIYNEDCFNTMKKMKDNEIDVVLTSPPYNMTSRKGGVSDTGKYDIYNDWISEAEYLNLTVDLFNGIDKVLVKNGVVLYNFSYSIENPSLPYKIVCEIEQKTPFIVVDTIVWKKKCGIPFPANERRLSRIWEFVFVMARKEEKDTYNCFKGVKSISEKTGQKYFNVYYNFVEAANNDGRCKLNQATYSSELCEKLLNIYCPKCGCVYDPFMGTGTTAVACKRMEINCIGSEISKEQCDWAQKRIAESNQTSHEEEKQ